MSWLSRRVKQSLRALHADMDDGDYTGTGPRMIVVLERRLRALRRYQTDTDLWIKRNGKRQLLHKGGKP